jgi:hypothetical protein
MDLILFRKPKVVDLSAICVAVDSEHCYQQQKLLRLASHTGKATVRDNIEEANQVTRCALIGSKSWDGGLGRRPFPQNETFVESAGNGNMDRHLGGQGTAEN